MTGPTPRTITRRAHAKINLALSVGPPQPPRGYHPIASWMVPIELHDDLTVSGLGPDEPSRYTITWAADAPKPSPIDWPVEKDLSVRAHRILERHTGRALPVEMTLAKRTPVGGGLGGGSSDAAAMFMAVNELYDLGLPTAELAALSAALGSDIAFFLDGSAAGGGTARAAVVTGFGDRVERVTTPAAALLLLIPAYGCPTGAVYGAYDRGNPGPLREADIRRLVERSAELRGIPSGHTDLFNDLTEPAGAVEPRLATLLKRLLAFKGVNAHLTGSGSTVFMVLNLGPGDCETVRTMVAAYVPDVTVLLTRTA